MILYGVFGLYDHLALQTNAFDLSVFDYALWDLSHLRAAHVPFMGQSLFSHHFMPTLAALVPVYVVFPHPILLIALQVSIFAVSGWLLFRRARSSLPTLASSALAMAYLFSRASTSAALSFGYLEAFEPVLVLLLVDAADRRSWTRFWFLFALALGCKEDMAIYLGAFALTLVMNAETRRMGAIGCVASVAWFAFAFLVAIPASRYADHLPTANPLMAARYGALDQPMALLGSALERLLSLRTLGVGLRSFGPSAFLCVLDPALVLVPLPGWVLNVAAEPGTMESAVLGHYWWPILPWIFISAVRGAQRVERRRPQVLRVVAIALIAFTVIDSPLWLRSARMSWSALRVGAAIARDLPILPVNASVVAQGNLVPHLDHRREIQVAGADLNAAPPDYVLLTTAGDLWPLTSREVAASIERFASNPGYRAERFGQLFVFARRRRANDNHQ